MPPSKDRRFQPVYEIARELSKCMVVSYYDNLLIKTSNTDQLKDISNREAKARILSGVFEINDILDDGRYNVLIVDDVFDTGSSLRAATNALRGFSKIDKIYVAVVTRSK